MNGEKLRGILQDLEGGAPTHRADVETPTLSIVTIADVSSTEQVNHFLQYLPKGDGIEVVLCLTQGGTEEGFESMGIDPSNPLRCFIYKYLYENWSFAAAKNAAKSVARGKWILFLDSDEYLPSHLHHGITEFLESIPDHYDGMFCHIASIVAQTELNKYGSSIAKVMRLFRNREDINFKGCCHELAEWCVPMERIGDCSLLIHHIGYDADKETLKGKLVRNLRLLAKDLYTINKQSEPERFAFIMRKLIDTGYHLKILEQ